MPVRAGRKVKERNMKTETIDLGNGETMSRGVFPLPDGKFLALAFSRSRTFKTRKGAERWLSKATGRAS